jgi:hypothetical protein
MARTGMLWQQQQQQQQLCKESSINRIQQQQLYIA